ncbi:MAG: hypothetical protein ACOYXC_13540 [Candidatus Rifleibacteriota bacterium]
MSKEIISRLYSTEAEVRKEAVYRILFDRMHELIPELKQAAFYEQNEDIALLIAQVAMTLEAFPRDQSIERLILEDMSRESGLNEMPKKMWDYLALHGNSQMLIAIMGAMNETIPPQAQDFMESCLNHGDPEIRSMACGIAINSGRPTHFAHVLNLITDPDPMVSEAAFKVVRNLPPSQMVIILDYALGSPDEWVLQNVAPFLPLLINNDLRKVIAKVQYHQHPLVSKKAREALKQLDSVPFVSKRAKDKQGEEEETEVGEGGENSEKEDFRSFKKEMEEKRRKHMEEERLKREEKERIDAEIAGTSEDEIEELAGELEQFKEEISETSGHDVAPVVEDDEPLIENLDFENEKAVLEEVDESAELEQVAEELEKTVVNVDEENSEPEMKLEPVSDQEEPVIDFDRVQQEIEQELQAETEGKSEPEDEISTTGAPDSNENAREDSSTQAANVPRAIELAESGDYQESTPAAVIISVDDSELAVEETDDTIENIMVEEVSIEIEDEIASEPEEKAERQPAKESRPAEVKVAGHAAKTSTDRETFLPAGKTIAKVAAKPAKKEEPVPEGAIKIAPIPAAQTIVSRYPSFISDPFAELFRPALPENHLKNLQLAADNLIAYLNICFIQSCLFFAPASEVLTKSVKECLKGHLIGPTALRCLHNFALAMKQSRENPVFFTFSLANILTESSDTNPVMMLRELKEYLKEPIDPLEESLPQAIEGLAEILRGVKSILNNLIVMRAPKGAKEPFADLSGPLAQVLAADKRPAIELPPGEVVVLSRDGTEAFGLFPYFKYARRKIAYGAPSSAEFKILLERLEIEGA